MIHALPTVGIFAFEGLRRPGRLWALAKASRFLGCGHHHRTSRGPSVPLVQAKCLARRLYAGIPINQKYPQHLDHPQHLDVDRRGPFSSSRSMRSPEPAEAEERRSEWAAGIVLGGRNHWRQEEV